MASTTIETTEAAESSHSDVSLWTDEQESALLQAIIRWKPVGMHKHFRMISIREYLLQQGVINPDDAHTSTAGIWRKLGSLYDLAKLDEREDSIIDGSAYVDDDDSGSSKGGATSDEYFRDFELPREEFEELMWEKRLAPEGTQSPGMSRAESTIPDTDEPARSSPVSSSTPTTRGGSARGGRGGSRRGRGPGRRSRLQNEVETEKTSSRRTSRANSVADEDQVMADADSEEEEQESSEDEEEESDEEQEEAEKKPGATRGGRAEHGRDGTPHGPRGLARVAVPEQHAGAAARG